MMKVISGFFLLFTTILMLLLELANDDVQKAIPDYFCTDDEISKIDAYIDITNDVETGKMGCFCSDNTSIFTPWSFFTSFKEVSMKVKNVEDS